jgi:hypothetical protein
MPDRRSDGLMPCAPGNDDAVLRWNACVQYLERHKELGPHPEEVAEPISSE